MSEMVERGANAIAEMTAEMRALVDHDPAYAVGEKKAVAVVSLVPEAAARAALLAALDPEDEDTCNDIGCELAGGSADEAEAVEWANITRCVLKALRNHIAQGES